MAKYRYCLVDYIGYPNRPCVIIESKMMALKIGKKYYDFSSRDHQSSNLYIINSSIHDGNVRILDCDDNDELLRERNKSLKRIVTIKSSGTPHKNSQASTKASTSTSNALSNKKKVKGPKQKDAGKKRKADKENIASAKKNISAFYNSRSEVPNDNDDEDEDDPLGNNPFNPPSPGGSTHSAESHPLSPESGPEFFEDNDDLHDNDSRTSGAADLRVKIATQEQEIKVLKRNSVTKEMLNDGLQQVLREISKDRENREQQQPHRGPLNHPPLNDDGKVQITTNFSMPFKEYLRALNAPDMRKRAVRVMAELWKEERREKLLVEADPKRPDFEIVSDQEYQKIIQICLTLQQIKCLECRQQDDVIANIRFWTSTWLKNWKPKKREARRRRNNPQL